MNGSTAPRPLASAAIVTISKLLYFSSSRSPCHTGRSKRQLHQDAQKSRNTFLPRKSDKACIRPDMTGRANSGAIRDVNRLFHSQAAGPKYQTLVLSSWATSCSLNRANIGEDGLLLADERLSPRGGNRDAN